MICWKCGTKTDTRWCVGCRRAVLIDSSAQNLAALIWSKGLVDKTVLAQEAVEAAVVLVRELEQRQ